MQTRSQRDAKAVYKKVDAALHKDKTFQSEYGRLCNRFPVMVQQNGLVQAMGFVVAKSENATFSQFGTDVADLLGIGNARDGLQQILQADLVKYQQLTRRALELAIWQRRFAESLLDVRE